MRLRVWPFVAVIAMVCPGLVLAGASGRGFRKDGSTAIGSPDEADSVKQQVRNDATNEAFGRLFLSFGWRHETGD